MTAASATQDTPIGPFTTIVDAQERVLASGWTADVEGLRMLVHPAIRPDTVRTCADLGAITAAVDAYHRGELDRIDEIAVAQRSGEFLMHAWNVLRTVEPGKPVTYSQFAELSGRPAAIRGAASACARNATALFVPCHRVVRIGGALGGFRWGLPVKTWLLTHEQV
ncbi:Methylated-DNA/protein-cysteinemethyltransferas e [Rhodococcus sp. AW25M09]|uniref:methylated-DNA--[protein]-cysteine S-methyltransferase n=1 Tax=Rhodococcus sp. AW25M09 TaxID=1268303 RepID=UPI0002AC7B9D|nr:methylated-DNA--[protein]-cysteine S-methyltransferase [Rhodococcus sp. AW25M09]CCQ15363.1 Methylated-DNA/protein-cysteinemethyltransferas e [Rhodococcus sp. AW25M09]